MPPSPYSTVQAARKLVAARLVEVMRDAGITTGRELARRLGWQESKVSRIINATTPPSEDDVRAWCAVCGATSEIPDLIASLRAAAGMWTEWRRMERSGLRVAQQQVLPLYERTTLFRAYSPALILGMVQTREYLTAVLHSIQRRRGLIDDVAAAVEVRMQRQELLRDPGKRFVLVVEESALRYRVADDATMAGQLGHLLMVMGLPNVRFGVVPQAAPRPLWPVEAFWIFDSEQVSAELVSGYLQVTAPREVGMYEDVFAELTAQAVFDADARRLIAGALESLG